MRVKEKRQTSNYETKDEKKKGQVDLASVRDRDRKWRGGCEAAMSSWGGCRVVVVGVSRG